MRKFEEADYKYCPSCECIIPLIFFYPDKKETDGFRLYCISCDNEKCRIQHQKTMEKHPLFSTLKSKKFFDKNPFYKKMRRNNLLKKGICANCENNPIDFSRSNYRCTKCLDNEKEKNKLRYEVNKWNKLF